MKISRFIVVAVFGLGLISQSSFSYVNVDQNNKMTHRTMRHQDKIACERSVLPLFNEKENRTLICKDETTVKHARKHEVNHERKHTRNHNMCGKGCHHGFFPPFNRKENRTCVCPNADENMVNKNDTMTYKTDKKMNYGTTKTISTKYNKN